MTILREHHPLQGQTLEVFSRVQRRGVLYLTLVLPDGSRSMIPAAWTDFIPNRHKIPRTHQPLDSSGIIGTVLHLLCTRKVVDALLLRIDSAEQPFTVPSEEERKRASTDDPVARNATPRSRNGDLAKPQSRHTKSSHHDSGKAHHQGVPSRKPHCFPGGQP